MDIRNPIGLMFLSLGILLTVYGLITNGDAELYKKSADTNINLYWGLLMAAFGAFMLGLAVCAAKKAKSKADGACGSGCGCSK